MRATAAEGAGRGPERHSGVAPLIVVDAGAYTRLVSDVGCFATAVFLLLALEATRDEHGRPVAETSVRMLARRLGVAKATAARVLSVLVKTGHLERLAQPRERGRFGPARYRVRLPTGMVRSPRRPRARGEGGRDGSQLGLFSGSSTPDARPPR